MCVKMYILGVYYFLPLDAIQVKLEFNLLQFFTKQSASLDHYFI